MTKKTLEISPPKSRKNTPHFLTQPPDSKEILILFFFGCHQFGSNNGDASMDGGGLFALIF
jgi:hypothetical protein